MSFSERPFLVSGGWYRKRGLLFAGSHGSGKSNRVAHVRLVIVGDGPDRSQLENLARRLNIAAAVEFVGHKTELRQIAGRSVCLGYSVGA